jgi:hypothetical protein
MQGTWDRGALNTAIAKRGNLSVPLGRFRGMSVERLPETIATGCTELDLAWSTYAAAILEDGVMIPDTEEDLNWHAFLGHSIDMQGFRAAEFAGVDELSKPAPGFVTLKERGIGVAELARLWEIPSIERHLREVTGTSSGGSITPALEVLRRDGGSVGASLADAYLAFPFRKTNSGIRAYLQNSAALAEHGYSFRRWLEATCSGIGVQEFPPADFRSRPGGAELSVEQALVRQLEASFYQVGPTMAPYMICDWQLWLWNEGKTAVFEAFKPDLFHVQFAKKYGRGVIPLDQSEFIAWWFSLYPGVPPRLVNECIWLAIEKQLVEV